MKEHRIGLLVWLVISTVGESALFMSVMGHQLLEDQNFHIFSFTFF